MTPNPDAAKPDNLSWRLDGLTAITQTREARGWRSGSPASATMSSKWHQKKAKQAAEQFERELQAMVRITPA